MYTKTSPKAARPVGMRIDIGGLLGERIKANLEQWQIPALLSNPAMIQAFYDRDRSPRRDLLPWSGEFPGKHLTASVLCYRLLPDPRLKEQIKLLVDLIADVQDEDGYIGPHPKSERMTGKTIWESKNPLWDVWGHYHAILGLLYWYDESGSKVAFDTAIKAADCVCRRFLDTGDLISEAGDQFTNHAIVHAMCLLYQRTGNERYLEMAEFVIKDWETPGSGDYFRTALDGIEFYQTPFPRWEPLHSIEALPEMYYITGDDRYRRAFEHIWHSILKTDVHNTGAFSSNEQAVGSPYDQRAIETCCSVAWIAMTVDMLKLTADSRVADQLEISLFNAMLGSQCPTGRYWTYNTPMDGEKHASAHDIVFQARAGSPELNCCSVNGPRTLGIVSEWAALAADDGAFLNYYGPGQISINLKSGNNINLVQETDYPADGCINLTVSPHFPEEFALYMRIPEWSKETKIKVNGCELSSQSGTYLKINREWKQGDQIEIELDMSPRYIVGEKECEGKISIFKGPILLTFDPAYNTMDFDNPPVMNKDDISLEPAEWNRFLKPWLLFETKAADGTPVKLCDFASAGWGGTKYRTWLPI